MGVGTTVRRQPSWSRHRAAVGLEGRKKEVGQASSTHSSSRAPLALSQGLTVVSSAPGTLTPGSGVLGVV